MLQMRKLEIKFYTPEGAEVARITAGRIDACESCTIISESKNDKFTQDHYFTDKLDHIDIFEGLITLYYEGDHYLEIRKIA